MNKVTSVLLWVMLSVFGAKVHAEIITGLTIKNVYSEARDKSIEVYYWYPTEEKTHHHPFLSNKIFEPVNVALDMDIAEGKHPVIVLLHGGIKSSFFHTGWIASSLAQNGYIVVSPRPPKHNEISPSQAVNEIVLRPGDLTLALSNIDSIKLFADKVDKQNIFGVGFFLGGTSMLMLTGAKLDPQAYKESCNAKGINIDCNWLLKN